MENHETAVRGSREATQSPDRSTRRLKSSSSPARSRVCDGCIRRKVKCDQRRPHCSRCLESGINCTYSSIRRKPGPVRGSQHAKQREKVQESSSHLRRHNSPQIPADDDTTLHDIVSTSEESPASSTARAQDTSTESSIAVQSTNSFESKLTPQQEEYLLDKYFDLFRDTNPIYSRENFLRNYRNELCSKDLISTMAMITAKLIGFAPAGSDIDTRIEHLLSSNHLEIDIMGDSPTLDQMRKALLLAFYEFHQFPGYQSWMQIGQITRIAFRIGLDQLDRLPMFYPDWAEMSKAELEEWRQIWWCLYQLDSYTNIATGTPLLIDKDYVNTALVISQSSTSPSSGGSDNFQPVYLPTGSQVLWEVVPQLMFDQDIFLAKIHLVTVTAMNIITLVGRQIYLVRGHTGTPEEELDEAAKQLSALRLALPFGWLNADRNVLAGESQPSHHARLVTIFHLSFAEFYLKIINCRREEGDEWTRSWQKILENCQNIAKAAAQWDSSFCVRVDPAICFILLTALVFLEIHQKKSVGSAAVNLEASIKQDQTIIRLLLDQFAKIWTLPRLILMSFESFKEAFSEVSGSLSQRQVKAILFAYKGPLHPRWVQFLASVRTVVNANG